MAIAPLQLPGYAASQPLDFTPLANLGNIYQKAQTDAAKKDILANAQLDGTPQTLSALATKLLPYDPQQAMTLAQLANTQSNTLYQHGRDDKNDTRQAQQDAAALRHQQVMEGLAIRSANRADEGPVEQARYREEVAKKYGIDPASPTGQAFIVSGKLPENFTNGGQPEVGLQPAYGVDASGKPAAVQYSKTGVAVQTKFPEGFQISKDPIKVDMGTHFQMFDPITRAPVGQPIPKNIVAAEAEKEKGSAQGIAEVGLPATLANAEQGLKTIDLVQNHPGKQYSLGMYSKVPTIPGTPQADFRAAANQLKGQTFLQAYGALRGSGAITDIEGKKGEDAIARLDQAQTVEAYDSALNDLKGVIKGGIDRAKQKAGKPAASQDTGTNNVTSSGVKWSIQ